MMNEPNTLMRKQEEVMKKLLLMLVVFLCVPALILAGTSGKIKGKVTLKDSHEPAIGASVLVEGTTLGASVDVNGNYSILNVPIGTYTVKPSFVGYHASAVGNVRVTADLTTELNFELVAEAVELPAMQIFAERPLVNKSATNAVRILGTEEMKSIPVRGLAGLFALQPGVVLQDNNIYIRGGREDEVGYYVEGASSRNVLNGQNAVTLIPEAVEEFQIQAGGYNAEYGGANAGIIRQQLRSGTSKYKLSYQGETDKIASDGDKTFDTYSYGYWDHVLTFSGPVAGDKVKLFLAGENQFMRDRTPSFWNGFEFPNADFPDALYDGPGGGREPRVLPDGSVFHDSLLAGPGVPSSPYDSRLGALVIPSGAVPGRMSNRWTANGTLIVDLNPVIFRFASALSWQRRGINDLPVQNILNLARLPLRDNSTGLYNLKMTHLLNPTTFYEVNFNYFDSRDKRYDPDFQDR